MQEPSLLNRFAQYLKDTHGPLGELQFLIAANDLQNQVRRIMNMNADDRDEQENSSAHMQWNLWELYKNYVHETAPDRLHLPEDLVDELRSIIESRNIDAETIENLIQKVDSSQFEFVMCECLGISYRLSTTPT